MLSTFSSHGHSFWARAKTWGAKIFFICPGTLPQNLEQIWWLFEKVKKCSTLMLSTFSRNLAKSQKSKFQIDLTATVFELDSSCWASSPLYMPRLPSTNFGADLVTFEKKSPSKSCSFFRRPNFDQKFQISENLPNIVLRHVQALGIIWSHLEQVRWVSKSVPL